MNSSCSNDEESCTAWIDAVDTSDYESNVQFQTHLRRIPRQVYNFDNPAPCLIPSELERILEMKKGG